MPPRAAPAPANGQVDGAPRQQQQPMGWLSGIGRLLFFYWIVKQFFGGGGQKTSGPAGTVMTPLMPRGEMLDMYVYMTETPVLEDWSGQSLIWSERGIPLATDPKTRPKTIMYKPSEAVQNNGSLYLHAYFAKAGLPVNPHDADFQPGSTFFRTHPLIRYLPKPKKKEGVNLLKGTAADGTPLNDTALPANASEPREIISFLKPNMTISLVDDFQAYNPASLPAQMRDQIDFDVIAGKYSPHIYFNEFWLLRDSLVAMNDTVQEVPMHFEVSAIGQMKWQIFIQMEQSFSMQQSWGAMADGESDEFKRVLLEGNPIFLGITFAVSLLHSLFDMLAFKNDIGFWKNKKNVEGLSVRTIGINCGCQTVIFFYLLDNDTSMLVLFSAGLGTLIEYWKLTQAMHITLDTSGPYPRIVFRDRDSYTRSHTDQYDREAMRYLSYALYPLLIAYAIYSLMYETHKSWYSFILNTLVGAVYAFGFILMCPQLYLNYKLKSVAHLPWRQMTYKFLNTIIDDLFAFVIKMPTLHRLSVFRDDLVFLVYIYQRWAYRVDKKRANEFGYAEEAPDDEGAEEERKALEQVPAAVAATEGGEGDARQRKGAAASATAAKPVANGAPAAAAASEVKKDK